MDFVQKSNFFLSLLVTEIVSQKNHLFDILDRKQSDQDQKIEVLTRAQKWTFFLKGLAHGFCPKIELFLSAFFKEIISEKMVFDIVERKE